MALTRPIPLILVNSFRDSVFKDLILGIFSRIKQDNSLTEQDLVPVFKIINMID